jgi:hypothetical protein
MKTKNKKPPHRTCAYRKTMANMPPRSHWPKRPEEFKISSSQVIWYILNETDISDWSRATKIFCEASKNKVIVFDRNTRMWRGHLYDGKVCKSPATWNSKQSSPLNNNNNNNKSQRTSAPIP